MCINVCCHKTQRYKSPELLYGSRAYDHTIDIWAAGCILIELLTAKPIFQGETDIDQLCQIFMVLGTINVKEYNEATQLPDYNKIIFENIPPKSLTEMFPNFSEQCIFIIKQLLSLNPKKRPNTSHVYLLNSFNQICFKKVCDLQFENV